MCARVVRESGENQEKSSSLFKHNKQYSRSLFADDPGGTDGEVALVDPTLEDRADISILILLLADATAAVTSSSSAPEASATASSSEPRTGTGCMFPGAEPLIKSCIKYMKENKHIEIVSQTMDLIRKHNDRSCRLWLCCLSIFTMVWFRFIPRSRAKKCWELGGWAPPVAKQKMPSKNATRHNYIVSRRNFKVAS